MIKGIIKSIGIKNRLHKKFCRLKNPLEKTELESKVKNYKKILLKLMENSKSNNFNKCFHENKLNLFKTWESFRDIIIISKNGKAVLTSIQIEKKLLKKPSEMNLIKTSLQL